MDHYWFNGRDGSFEEQAAMIVGTHSGVKIEDGETLWWDVEAEGSKPHWTVGEVVQAAKALEAAGIPLSRQGIYMSSSVTRSSNWKPVVDLGLRLWIADYGKNDGTISSKPLAGHWPEVALFQYTSVGKLPGYDGNLDLNISGESEWTVHKLQETLNEILGLSLTVDGDFGPASRAAVIEFQTLKGLTPDGVPGFNTLTALEEAIAD